MEPQATVVYGLLGAGLFFLTLNPEKVGDRGSLKLAWYAYLAALIPGVLAGAGMFFVWFWYLAAWSLVIVSGFCLKNALPTDDDRPAARRPTPAKPARPAYPEIVTPTEVPPATPAPPNEIASMPLDP